MNYSDDEGLDTQTPLIETREITKQNTDAQELTFKPVEMANDLSPQQVQDIANRAISAVDNLNFDVSDYESDTTDKND